MADPKIGLALGGGSARGMAHIPLLEALDEYGITPARIAGTSIGALYGAARASGLTGKEIRAFTLEATKDVGTMVQRLWATQRARSLKEMFDRGLSMQLDSRDVVQSFIPGNMAKSFEAMAIPFSLVATDFYTWEEKIFSSGEILSAIAASIAIPSFFKPVEIEGHTYIDGSAVTPVPFAQAGIGMDYVIAIDVTGSPDDVDTTRTPSAIETAIVAMQIMQSSIVSHSMALHRPHIYIKPYLEEFRAHEFYRAKEILAAGDMEKDNLKRHLDQLLK